MTDLTQALERALMDGKIKCVSPDLDAALIAAIETLENISEARPDNANVQLLADTAERRLARLREVVERETK